jgi:hypothetical protein
MLRQGRQDFLDHFHPESDPEKKSNYPVNPVYLQKQK